MKTVRRIETTGLVIRLAATEVRNGAVDPRLTTHPKTLCNLIGKPNEVTAKLQLLAEVAAKPLARITPGNERNELTISPEKPSQLAAITPEHFSFLPNDESQSKFSKNEVGGGCFSSVSTTLSGSLSGQKSKPRNGQVPLLEEMTVRLTK